MTPARDVEEIARKLFQDINAIYQQDFTEGEVILAKGVIARAFEDALKAERGRLPSFDEVETANAECNGNLRKLYDWLAQRMK